MDWSKIANIEEAKHFISNPHYKNTGGFEANKLMIDRFDFNDKVVLDFGCGVGRNLKYILETQIPARLIGYDYPNMINFAKQYLKDKNGLILKLIEYPIDNIKNIRMIDYVIADVVFQHIPIIELKNILINLTEMLYPVGSLLVSSRGYSDYELGDSDAGANIWEIIGRYFNPITTVDTNDASEHHQFVEYKAK
jgi:2-polyprenyl-3-methyl-5-hydroxy-6-metoxy-1,4-benzoquinol methylase